MTDPTTTLQYAVTAMALCTPRLAVAFIIAPFFNAQLLTGVTRNCIVVSLALILLPPLIPTLETTSLSIPMFISIMVKEGIIGAVFGFMTGLFFWAAEAVGAVIDRQRGTTIAEGLDPMTGSQSTPMGNFLLQTSIVLFFCAGGFLLFLSVVYESYRIWPILSCLPRLDEQFALFFLERTDHFMAVFLLLASPMLIVMFLSELGLGLMNRFAPQLNVFFLALPVKSALAILVLIVYLTFFVSYMKELLIKNMHIIDALKLIIQ